MPRNLLLAVLLTSTLPVSVSWGQHPDDAFVGQNIPKLKEAVVKKGIKNPVVVENNYQIWSDYICNTWPSHFVVDRDGVIQLSHSGMERYEDTEKVIQN
jgi:hypothetical protein